MMRQSFSGSDYQASAARATRDLKAQTLLRAMVGRLRDTLSLAESALSVVFAGGSAPHILLRNRSAEVVGRVTIDAESGLYVFCEFDDRATDIVIATASENRLIEEIALHLYGGYPGQRAVDAAVDILVGQTIEDVDRKSVV